ncbi:MAG TPA: ATP-binding protein [Saprospiraceae bacterium]|nr:ATP-binding protein [Saprospiraceae bacterium]HMQ81535.1 ATP-binding protein [Saprospiraceae bacterium]
MLISLIIWYIMAAIIIGREKERVKLNQLLTSNQSEFLALYGRRRVGKTFLIRQHLKDFIVFDLSGSRDGSKEQQLLNFYTELRFRTSKDQALKSPKSWQEAFQLLADYLYTLPPIDGKHVVFLDEMPWLDTPKSDFTSALEFFWNQHVSRMDHILLIACGSASSWIRKKLINARGGLYNRVTRRMKLAAFTLHETALFVKELGVNLPQYQLLELYMVMGGIPFYLKEIEKGKSATQLIDEICFSPQGLLYEEYQQLYHSLFRNATPHIAIVELLASRPQGLSRQEIVDGTKISEGQLSKALDELAECDFISLYQPFQRKKKDAVYKLTDLYSLFYLKYIQPNKGAGKKIWEQLSKQSTYTAWSGYAFENICMLHIDQIKSALGISGVYTQHSAWKFKGNDTLPGAQIDMVIDRADQIIHICEAKFTKEPFALHQDYTHQLRLKKAIFKQATQTKKAVFTTLLTTYPALQNKYYLEEVDSEITMDHLFHA